MHTLACDVGGTFTDLIVASRGRLRLFKAPTTPSDPVEGVLAAINLAAVEEGESDHRFLSETETFIHATTRAINAILTGATARTAFVTTAGHRDILLLREGGRLDPYDNRQEFPHPYVPRALTFELPERIGAAGEIVSALDEDAAVALMRRLGEAKVEAVAVCLLWSIANPVHELRLGQLLEEHLRGIPFTLSHRLNPIVREYRRASATAIDASLKPLMNAYLHGLSGRLRGAGFQGRLLMTTSQGGVIEAKDAAEAPIHVLKSGPALAPVAGARSAEEDAEAADAIVADTGGTSFEVSLVRGGRIPWTSETWIGPRFAGHMTGFPSVDVKSIGAGGGSIVRLDEAGLLHVGPESAGAEPGPVAYGRGGERPTITDCALVAGLLSADTFLGGRLHLDLSGAFAALDRLIAKPLGIGVEEAAYAALDVLSQNMISAIEEITVRQGIDPARTVLIAGGGAAGFNAVAIGKRLGCRAILFPETGAALSAAGALSSDLVHSAVRMLYQRSDSGEPQAVARVLRDLEGEAAQFFARMGGGRGQSVLSVEARYPQQTWEIEMPVPWEEQYGVDLEALAGAFHDAHEKLYAVCDRASPVEFIAWRVRASVARGGLAARLSLAGMGAEGSHRPIWLPGEGSTKVPVSSFFDVPSDSALAGPAIVESALTTIFVPRGSRARRLASGTIEVT
jgi:N-methylhydantoinase A